MAVANPLNRYSLSQRDKFVTNLWDWLSFSATDGRRDVRRSGRSALDQLGGGWLGLAVIFDMRFGCFPRVMRCVFVMTAG